MRLWHRTGLVMRAASLTAAAAVIAGGALAGGVPALAASVHRHRTLAENRAAARVDAKALVKLVRLPAGAVALSLGSRAPGPLLLSPEGAYGETRWHVPAETPAQVLAYVRAHPPAGGTLSGYGSTSSGGTSSPYVEFVLKDTVAIDARVIDVSATSDPGGASTVTVEAESVAFVPRSAASMIPAGVSSISVEDTDASGVVQSDTVSSSSRVAASVRFFDGLEADQPFYLACPVELSTGDAIAVSFLNSAGTVLARATYAEVDGGDSGACSPVRLVVGHRFSGEVYGGDYVASLNRLLDITLPTGSAGGSTPAP